MFVHGTGERRCALEERTWLRRVDGERDEGDAGSLSKTQPAISQLRVLGVWESSAAFCSPGDALRAASMLS